MDSITINGNETPVMRSNIENINRVYSNIMDMYREILEMKKAGFDSAYSDKVDRLASDVRENLDGVRIFMDEMGERLSQLEQAFEYLSKALDEIRHRK